MFNKLFLETYTQVRQKADEVRSSVMFQAARAREALGLPTNHLDAQQLQKSLESQATKACTMAQLHNLYINWIAQIVTSASPETQLYYDQSTVFGILDFAHATTLSRNAGDVLAKPWIPLSSPDSKSAVERMIEEESEVGSSSQVVDEELSSRTEGLTFWEVFLRSRALEQALICLARLVDVRQRLIEPHERTDSEESSTFGALERLLSLTLLADGKLCQELIFLFCSVDLKNEAWEGYLRHLVELVTVLKQDWTLEHYSARRRNIIEKLEAGSFLMGLPETSKSAETIACSGEDIKESLTTLEEENQQSKSEQYLSGANLKQSYASAFQAAFHISELRKIEVKAAKRRVAVQAKRRERLRNLGESIESLCAKFSSIEARALAKEEKTNTELSALKQEGEKQLVALMGQSATLHEEVEKLEVEQEKAAAVLESITIELEEKSERSREIRHAIDILKSRMSLTAASYKREIFTEVHLQKQSKISQRDMASLKSLADQAAAHLNSSVNICSYDTKKHLTETMNCYFSACSALIEKLKSNMISAKVILDKINLHRSGKLKAEKEFIEERNSILSRSSSLDEDLDETTTAQIQKVDACIRSVKLDIADANETAEAELKNLNLYASELKILKEQFHSIVNDAELTDLLRSDTSNQSPAVAGSDEESEYLYDEMKTKISNLFRSCDDLLVKTSNVQPL